MPSYFFFSYAREDDIGGRLQTFYSDLRQEIMSRTGCTAAEATFFDQDQKRGVEWTVNITTALAQSRTIVCLYSPIYFQREFCGKEFQVFLNRRNKYKEQHPGSIPTNIIPVRWLPGGDQVPIPYFFDTLDKTSTYAQEGLGTVLELAQGGAQAENLWYIRFKKKLAGDILDAARKFQLDPLGLPLNMVDAGNAFEVRRPRVVSDQSKMDTGPNSATFLYVGAEDAWEWNNDSPCAPPPQDAAGSVSSAIAGRNDIVPQQIPMSADTLDTFGHLDYLHDKNGRVVVLVNGNTIHQPLVSKWLVDYEQRQYKNCATLILGAPAPAELFPKRSPWPKDLFWNSIDRADELSAAILSSLGALKPAIIHTSSTQREGPPNPQGFQAPPILAGPGAK